MADVQYKTETGHTRDEYGELPAGWKCRETVDHKYMYYHRGAIDGKPDGTTTWERPGGRPPMPATGECHTANGASAFSTHWNCTRWLPCLPGLPAVSGTAAALFASPAKKALGKVRHAVREDDDVPQRPKKVRRHQPPVDVAIRLYDNRPTTGPGGDAAGRDRSCRGEGEHLVGDVLHLHRALFGALRLRGLCVRARAGRLCPEGDSTGTANLSTATATSARASD